VNRALAFTSLTGAVLLATYAILFVGTEAGWLIPLVRLANVIAMSAVILLWVRQLTRQLDLIDAASIAFVVAVGLSTVTALIPRLSADAFFGVLACAALLGVVRRIEHVHRQNLVTAMALLGVVVSVALLLIWGAEWLRWIIQTGTPPSLELPLPRGPFGHRHDAAILVGLLAPAVAATWGSRYRASRVATGSVMGLMAVVIFMSGGRAVWLGAVVATTATVVMTGQIHAVARWLRAHLVFVAGAVVVVVAAALATGLGGPVGERLTSLETVDMRMAIWRAAADVFLRAPIFGSGPGTFAFAMHTTDYFDRAVFAPKHADNLYVQLFSELGVIGVICVGVLVAAILRAWTQRRPPTEAVWALVFAAVAGLGHNPSALGFGAILISVWAGVSSPTEPALRASRVSPLQWLAPVAVAVIGLVPILTASFATFAFERARADANDGAAVEAIDAADEAVALDPGFPLYVRQRAELHLRVGDIEGAVADAAGAVALNRFDDASLRVLAVALGAHGDTGAALATAERAAELQRSDPMNQVLVAIFADSTRRLDVRDEALLAAATLTPWMSADPALEQRFPDLSVPDLVAAAADRAAEGRWLDTADARWPQAMAAINSPKSGEYDTPQRAMVLGLDCQIDQALATLEDAEAADREGTPDFAYVEALMRRLAGTSNDAVDYEPLDTISASPLGDPLEDEARYSRLVPTPWLGVAAPSDVGGRLAWLADPAAASARVRGSACG
jgi:hypothetical protein